MAFFDKDVFGVSLAQTWEHVIWRSKAGQSKKSSQMAKKIGAGSTWVFFSLPPCFWPIPWTFHAMNQDLVELRTCLGTKCPFRVMNDVFVASLNTETMFQLLKPISRWHGALADLEHILDSIKGSWIQLAVSLCSIFREMLQIWKQCCWLRMDYWHKDIFGVRL